MNKVLLVHPYSGFFNEALLGPHLGLLSIGTVLKQKGYEVKIINVFPQDVAMRELGDEVKDEPIFIGITAMTPQVPFALEVTRFLKKHIKCPIVWGGVHATLFPEQTVMNSMIDIAVLGEGEETCVELTDKICNQQNLNDVRGICFKEGDKLVKTASRPYCDMNAIPGLNYRLSKVDNFIWQDFSAYNGPKRCRTLNLVSSRGCPNKCTFCINNIVYKNGFRAKRADIILDEMEDLIEKYNIEHVAFRDEEFFASKKRVTEFLAGLEKRKIKITWHAEVRANHFRQDYINLDMAKRIRDLGCFWLSMGVETSSERLLKKIRKGITIEQADVAYETCLKAGITLSSGFIIGLPTESKMETYNTIKYIYDRWRVAPKMRPIIVSIFRPYPGSELFDECRNLGYEENNSLEDWSKENFYETNYQNISNYPWIKDSKYIKIINFTWRNVFSNYKRSFDWIYWSKILVGIGKLRIELNFWSFPMEMVIFEFVRNILVVYRRRSI